MDEGKLTGKTAEQFTAERKSRQAQAEIRAKSKEQRNAGAQKLTNAETREQELQNEMDTANEHAKGLMRNQALLMADLERQLSEINDVNRTLEKMQEDGIDYVTDSEGMQVSRKTLSLRHKQKLVKHNAFIIDMQKTERILKEGYGFKEEDLSNMYKILLGQSEMDEAFELRIKKLVDNEETPEKA